jgi:hypothetical protein
MFDCEPVHSAISCSAQHRSEDSAVERIENQD